MLATMSAAPASAVSLNVSPKMKNDHVGAMMTSLMQMRFAVNAGTLPMPLENRMFAKLLQNTPLAAM